MKSKSGGNDSSLKGPYGQGVRTYGTIGLSYPRGGHHDGGNNYHGGYGEGECVHDHSHPSKFDKPTKSLHSKFDTSKPHIGLESQYGKDEKGNCIIAEKFSGILKSDPKALSKIKVITVGDTNMDYTAVSKFADVIQHEVFNLEGFYFHNNKIDNDGVYRLLNGVINAPTWRNITKIDFSNNNIGDKGVFYLTDSLTHGQLPNTRCLDVSGNRTSYELCNGLSKIVQGIKQDIKILVGRLFSTDTIIQGGKKQSDLFYGSKEEKQMVIKDILKQAQSNGVDIQNVVVSKDIFTKIINREKLGFSFLFGIAKCKIVPKDFTAFTIDKIIAQVSPHISGVKSITDIVACYFETFDKSASSQEGIQFMLDIGLVGQGELLENNE